MGAPLLADSNIPFEIIIFLVAGAVTLIGKLNEKAKKAREKILREQQREAARERVDFPGIDAPMRTPPPPLSPVPPLPPAIRRQKTVSAPVVMTPHAHTRGPGAKRRKPRPAAPVAAVPSVPDANYQRQLEHVHPAVRRLRGNPNALRDAIVLREIFGPPVALRMQGRPGTWQRR